MKSANIEYVKWDMNRQLTDLGSEEFYGDRAGELYHRYVLGVYELQERLVTDFLIYFSKTVQVAEQDLMQECFTTVHRFGAQMTQMLSKD